MVARRVRLWALRLLAAVMLVAGGVAFGALWPELREVNPLVTAWIATAAAGLGIGLWALQDAVRDALALRRMGIDDARNWIARANVVTAAGHAAVMVGFLAMGAVAVAGARVPLVWRQDVTAVCLIGAVLVLVSINGYEVRCRGKALAEVARR